MNGKDLRDLRIDRGLLQKEVASLANISGSFYCLVERGIRMPSLETMNTYLRPATLFGPKFEGYLNEKPRKEVSKIDYGW